MLVAPDDPAGTAFVAAPAESITAAGLETLGGSGGMILLALDDAITRRLGLPEVRPGARPRAPLPFVVPIDAAQSPARRWSVVDPALTMRVAAAADSGPDDLAVPGRVQPVGATRRRLLDDGGSVSAALALAHHAGRREAVALCASRTGALPPRRGGGGGEGEGGGRPGGWQGQAARPSPIVATHAACLFGDTFGSLVCDCRPSLDRSLAEIVTACAGVFVYTKPASRARAGLRSDRRPDGRVIAGCSG